jgi:ABC-type cobalt transport system substrate-binding protein
VVFWLMVIFRMLVMVIVFRFNDDGDYASGDSDTMIMLVVY